MKYTVSQRIHYLLKLANVPTPVDPNMLSMMQNVIYTMLMLLQNKSLLANLPQLKTLAPSFIQDLTENQKFLTLDPQTLTQNQILAISKELKNIVQKFKTLGSNHPITNSMLTLLQSYPQVFNPSAQPIATSPMTAPNQPYNPTEP